VLGVDDFSGGLVAGGGAEESDGAFARGLDFEVQVAGFRSHGHKLDRNFIYGND